MKWPNFMCATWWAATPTGWPTRNCTGSSFRSVPGHCSSSSRPSAHNGMSAYFTTGITDPTTGACSQESRCRPKRKWISSCTSTSCSTPTPRRPTIRLTGCFWEPDLRVVNGYPGARSLHRVGIRFFLPGLGAAHYGVVGPAGFDQYGYGVMQLFGCLRQFPEVFQGIRVYGVSKRQLRVRRRRSDGPDLDGLLALGERLGRFVAIHEQPGEMHEQRSAILMIDRQGPVIDIERLAKFVFRAGQIAFVVQKNGEADPIVADHEMPRSV